MHLHDLHETASSAKHLLDVLSRQNIAVPPQSKGRTRGHCERWVIVRWLSTFAERSDHFVYPLTFEHCVSDRSKTPDLRFYTPSASYGIEVTDACDQAFEWASAVAATTPGSWWSPSSFAPDRSRPKRIESHVRTTPFSGLGGQGDLGYLWEEQWAVYVSRAIAAKAAKLTAAKAQRHDRNWLLVHDGTPPRARMGNLDEGVKRLRLKITDIWERSPAYEKVFIERRDVFVVLTPMEQFFLPVTKSACTMRIATLETAASSMTAHPAHTALTGNA